MILLLIGGACASGPSIPAADLVPRFRSGVSSADSAAVLAVIGDELRSEQARRVADRFHCGARLPGCVDLDGWSAWMPTMDPLLGDLAYTAGAALVRPDRTRIPPCPWNGGATEPVGYLAWLPHPFLRGDSAAVRVHLSCLNALNSSDRNARRELLYALVRQGPTWGIVARSIIRGR